MQLSLDQITGLNIGLFCYPEPESVEAYNDAVLAIGLGYITILHTSGRNCKIDTGRYHYDEAGKCIVSSITEPEENSLLPDDLADANELKIDVFVQYEDHLSADFHLGDAELILANGEKLTVGIDDGIDERDRVIAIIAHRLREIAPDLRTSMNAEERSYQVDYHYEGERAGDRTAFITEKSMDDFPESEDKFVYFDLPLNEAIEACIDQTLVGDFYIDMVANLYSHQLKEMLSLSLSKQTVLTL